MKTYFHILILSVLFSGNLFAQTLVDTGKVWSVISCWSNGDCVTDRFHFGNDTVIGTLQYKKLITTADTFGIGTHLYVTAAREDTVTKKVFFYKFNEYLAYDFSLNEGDTFTTNIDGCAFQMVVDSVDTVILLNGEPRKRLFFYQWSDIWIEGIGSSLGVINIGLYSCTADIYDELLCFEENDTLKYQNTNYPDCYYNTTGIQDSFDKNQLSIYPNPFSDFTTIKFKDAKGDYSIRIISQDGQLVRRYLNMSTDEIKIEKGNLSSGIYFVQLFNENGISKHEKLVVE